MEGIITENENGDGDPYFKDSNRCNRFLFSVQFLGSTASEETVPNKAANIAHLSLFCFVERRLII